MRWLKLYTEIVNDPKIRILAFEDRWHYVALLCAKAEGLLDSDAPIRERLIRVHLGLAELDADNLKKRLVEACLISDDWQPSGWQKRQAVDPTGAERQRRHRAAKAAESDSSRDSHVTVTRQSRSRVEESKSREDKTLPKGSVRDRRKRRPPAPVEEVVSIYQEILPELPFVATVTKQRKTRIRTHHEGIMEGDLSNWRGYFLRVKQSAFLTGQKTDWRADIDFLLRPDTPTKVLEGKYDR